VEGMNSGGGGHSVQVIYDESLTILYVQNGARFRYIRRSGHRYRSRAEYSSCVSKLILCQESN
jgi:hypothetical protein